jgi:16S rRNA A1518/A1519 N6-dimethyltransferase RsmA/KsgA/DIM1 with predicted DNA glycosylase/AP lyase activity
MKLEFNEQQLQVLNAAIVELPYRISAPLVNHINHQIQQQRALEFDERREAAQKNIEHHNV